MASEGYVVALYWDRKLVGVLPQKGPAETEEEANRLFNFLTSGVELPSSIDLENESGERRPVRFNLCAVIKGRAQSVFDPTGWGKDFKTRKFEREKTPAEKKALERKQRRHK